MKGQSIFNILAALLLAVLMYIVTDHSKVQLKLATQQEGMHQIVQGLSGMVITNDIMFANALNQFYAKYETEKTNWIKKGSFTNLPIIKQAND